MMKLNKRYFRNIKSNISFYISASLLTAISAFLLVNLYTAIKMIDTGFEEIMRKGNVESAQFTTLAPIKAEEFETIENKYNVELEGIKTADIEENGYTLRIFAPTEKINRYQVLEGSDIKAEDEILINRDFAIARKISLGETFRIKGNTYKITGFAVRPDYLYAQKDTRDFYVDKNIFGQVTMTEASIKKLQNPHLYYAVVYHADNSIEFRRYLNEKYGMLSYLPAASNNRIDIVSNFAEEYGIMQGMISPVMFVLITVIVAVVLGRVVKREQKQIGTLVALGYRKREIVRHYALYAAIPGILGSIAGIVLAAVFLRPVSILFATDYESINFDARLYWESILCAFAIPVVLYILTAVFSVRRLLRKNTVLLLSGSKDTDKQKRRGFLSKSRLSFGAKFRLRALLAHKSRTFVVVMGMFVGTFLFAFGLIMIDSSSYLITKGLDNAGTYEYQYILNTVKNGTPETGEPELCFNFEVPGHEEMLSLSGLKEEPKYLKLTARTGSRIEYGRYYLTSNAAALYGISAGDRLTLINPFTTKRHTVIIEDILDDNTKCALYTSTANVSKMLGLPENSYNVVLSDRKIELDSGMVAYTNSKENLKKQLQFSIDLIKAFIYLLLSIGAALCITAVYLTVNMLLEENRHNISMLKVLGYRKREINRLVLDVNHILVPISFVLGILACIKLCERMFEKFISELNLYLEPAISLTSILLCAAVLLFSYTVSLLLLKRKVYKVDMVDSLKDNRE